MLMAMLATLALAKDVQFACPKPGDQVTYQIESDSKKLPQGGTELVSNGRMRYSYQLKVDKVEGSVLHLSLRSSPVEVLVPPPDPILQEILAGLLAEPLPTLTVLVDTEQATVRYADTTPILDLYTRMFDGLLPKLQERYPEVPPSVGLQIKAALLSPEVVNGKLSEVMLPLALFSCSSQPLGATQYQGQAPNLMGGSPIDMSGTAVVTAKGKALTADLQEVTTPESAKAAAIELVQRMGVPPQALEEALKQVSLDFRTSLKVVGSSKAAWPTWTGSRTVTVSGNVVRADSWEVTRLP